MVRTLRISASLSPFFVELCISHIKGAKVEIECLSAQIGL